jgi:16S rRNA (adenine1518-N6/adenine1519-N6)-dimethyltransferase
LGQNFLVDRNILNIFVESASVQSTDRVLEIGPGLGVLTEEILARAAHLTAVEKDKRLYAWLSGHLADRANFTLIEGDVLKVGIPALLAAGVDKVLSNLPYTPGSRILLDIVRDINGPSEIAVTVQLEVAQRITAKPGSKTFGLMGVWCQLHYDTRIVKVISPNCFWPRPDVKSAIVHLQRRKDDILPQAVEEYFYRLTRYVFQHRRKQLAATLAKAPTEFALPADACRGHLVAMGASETARPEELGLAQWCQLVQLLNSACL